MRTETETELLTPTEVARLFRVDAKTVTRWAKEGRLPYQRTLGGHRRYPAEAVRQLIGQRINSASGTEAHEHDWARCWGTDGMCRRCGTWRDGQAVKGGKTGGGA